MLIHACVNLDQLARESKDYKWSRPKSCSRCGLQLWGHGYVGRYFDGFKERLWLKRYRCSCCKLLITMIPNGCMSSYQASFFKIYFSLLHRLSSYKWPPWVSRQRGRHWLSKLKKYCQANFGLTAVGMNLKNKLKVLFKEQTNFLVS